MNKTIKRILQNVVAYLAVYFTLIIYIELSTFEQMVTLALAYLIVDATIIRIKLESGEWKLI